MNNEERDEVLQWLAIYGDLVKTLSPTEENNLPKNLFYSKYVNHRSYPLYLAKYYKGNLVYCPICCESEPELPSEDNDSSPLPKDEFELYIESLEESQKIETVLARKSGNFSRNVCHVKNTRAIPTSQLAGTVNIVPSLSGMNKRDKVVYADSLHQESQVSSADLRDYEFEDESSASFSFGVSNYFNDNNDSPNNESLIVEELEKLVDSINKDTHMKDIYNEEYQIYQDNAKRRLDD